MSEDWSKAIFREEADELLAELETTLLELEERTTDADLVNRVFRALHTIKGSGAMFGFDEIAEFAHEVETLFDRVRGGELVVTRAVLDVSFKARDHIKNLLADSLSDDESQAALVALKQELVEVAAGASPHAKPLVVDDVVEPQEAEKDDFVLLESPSESIAKSESSSKGHCVYHIDIRPRAGSLPDGYPLEPLFEELECIGEIEVDRLESSDGIDHWKVTIVTDSDEDEVRDVFFFADVDLDISITCLDDSMLEEANVDSATAEPGEPSPDALSQPDAPLDKSLEELQLPATPVEHTPTAVPVVSKTEVVVSKDKVASSAASLPDDRPMPEKASSLRVTAAKLDKLVDLVGELVIIQSQLSQHAVDRNDPPLTLLSEGLDRLVEELRDTTLGVRMVPIGTTFSKFRRLVRDLTTELNKKVEFIPVGAATELDKTVIERLSDPLVHLLRNSMDHGIETPEKRLAAGKPEHGTIHLSAEHSAGEVLIRMSDDGRGIDPETVRQKAQEAGLLDPGAEVSERELFRLLFTPGFSTAEEVTSLSGRGVGMDVVQQAIESLRGSIVVDSKLGVGTNIAIRLPLTLAIIDGLQVRTEDETYVIPLTQVEECVELVNGQRREQDGCRILDLRGEIVPYVNLREWFEIPGVRPVMEQVVIATVDKRRVGIVVDDVIGEYQTVIKTLGRIYRDVEGISGATVRGDGSIALILDVPGLVRSVAEQG